MATRARCGKLYPLFTMSGAQSRRRRWVRAEMEVSHGRGIATAMFIALFGWGANYFGWYDPAGKVQLALFTSFILGIVSGYKIARADPAPRRARRRR